MTTFKEKFGKRVREIRKEKGFTQEQIAEKIGIEPPNISKLENGAHFPLPENIEKLANALSVDIKELFDFNHFDEKTLLTQKIKNFLSYADKKDIEFLYKTIINLGQYKNN